MERALILSADRWSMKDERTGQERAGWSLWFVNQYRENSENAVGLRPTKISVTDELVSEVKKLSFPLMGDLSFGSRPGEGGKATLTITAIKALGTLPDFFKAQPKATA